MSKVSYQQNALNAGEFSPLLYGRQDIAKYAHGLAQCENFIPVTQGGITRRTGTRFILPARVYASESLPPENVRLVPFFPSAGEAYVLELAHNNLRVHTEYGTLVETPVAVTAISLGATTTITAPGHGFVNNDRVTFFGVPGTEQVNGMDFQVASATTDTFTIRLVSGSLQFLVDSTNWDAYDGPGGFVVKIFEFDDQPLLSENLEQGRLVNTASAADTLYLFFEVQRPAYITRLSPVDWVHSYVSPASNTPFLDGPYLSLNFTATELSLEAISGDDNYAVTAVDDIIDGINGGAGFLNTDLGRLIRIWSETDDVWYVLQIYQHVTPAGPDIPFVRARALYGAPDLDGLTTGEFRLSLFGNFSSPRAGVFHEDRLWVGGGQFGPHIVAASASGRYLDFAPTEIDGTVAVDNGFTVPLSSGSVDFPHWFLSTDQGLLIGTGGGEWAARPSSDRQATTAVNVRIGRATAYGSESAAAPQPAADGALFVEKGGTVVRELSYDPAIDGLRASDVTVLASHLQTAGIIHSAYQRRPWPIAWFADRNGRLLGLTYDKENDVVAWHHHDIGGKVRAMAVIPSPDGLADDLWLAVERTIEGRQYVYVEVLDLRRPESAAMDDATYLDCSISVFSEGGISEVGGLLHLEGLEVGVIADGGVHPRRTVENGKIHLTGMFNTVTVGLPYSSEATTLPIEAGSQDGSAQTKIKRISRIGFWLYNTLGLKVGPAEGDTYELLEASWGDDYGAPVPFSGVVRKRFEGDYDRVGQVHFRVDDPLPATINTLVMQLRTEDES